MLLFFCNETVQMFSRARCLLAEVCTAFLLYTLQVLVTIVKSK